MILSYVCTIWSQAMLDRDNWRATVDHKLLLLRRDLNLNPAKLDGWEMGDYNEILEEFVELNPSQI